MPSPTCTVNASATTGGVNVTASSTVTIQLVDLTATAWAITCVGTDELAATPTLTINQTTKTATFTSGAAGSAYRLQSVVNNGQDAQGPNASYTTTFTVYVTASGNRTIPFGEQFEANVTAGWLDKINPLIRAVPTAAGGGAIGDLLYWTGSAWTRLADVATGSVLAAGGVGVAPTWSASPTITNLTLTGGTFTWAASATAAIAYTAKTAAAASQAGSNISITAQPATAGTSSAGAANGGGFTFYTGAAAQYLSGAADGGNFTVRFGTGVSSGKDGRFVLQKSDATTFASIGGAVAVGYDGLLFGSTVTPTIFSDQPTTDVATHDLTIQSMAPNAGATGTNRNPGNLVLKVPQPATGGANGKISLSVTNTEAAYATNDGLHTAQKLRVESDSTQPDKNAQWTVEADLTTTDATTSTLYSFTPPVSTSLRIYATIIAEKSDGTDDYGVDVVASFRVDGAGVVTVRLAATKSNEQTATAAIGAVTIDTSGGAIRVRVTGVAAQTWRWGGAISVVQRSVAA